MCWSTESEEECPYTICFLAHSEFDIREATFLSRRQFRPAAIRWPIGRELRQHESALQLHGSALQLHESARQQHDSARQQHAYTQQVSVTTPAKLALLIGQLLFPCFLR